MSAGADRWADALMSVALFAVDPVATGGLVVRARTGPVRDRLTTYLRALLPRNMPVRRVPATIPDGRLLGGLDLAATLSAGRPVAERGVLADAHDGVVILPMAERITPLLAARLNAAMDRGEIVLERDGLHQRVPARFGMVLLDEGAQADEAAPDSIADRLAFRADLDGIALGDAELPEDAADGMAEARAVLADIAVPDDAIDSLTGVALALGIASLRAPMLALGAARSAAALALKSDVDEDDIALAARLVLAPRATRMPVPEGNDPADAPDPPDPAETQPPDRDDGTHDPPERDASEERDADTRDPPDRPLEDVVLDAAVAAIPNDLLASLQAKASRAVAGSAAGRAGALRASRRHGRPIGTRSGDLRDGARLNVLETLRAAAPWQKIRRRMAKGPSSASRVLVRREDFRLQRYKEHAETTTVFVVDASGSSALARLAEAKGAVELLLADCYIRRDEVALFAFRGHETELLLPPTRSLVRAKRALAALPGGGGTPLAGAIDTAARLAEDIQRKGRSAGIVFMTDGRANIARDGTPGRSQAREDALAAARLLRARGLPALLVDTSPRPQDTARRLAEAMGGVYLPLPQADAAALSVAVRETLADHHPTGRP